MISKELLAGIMIMLCAFVIPTLVGIKVALAMPEKSEKIFFRLNISLLLIFAFFGNEIALILMFNLPELQLFAITFLVTAIPTLFTYFCAKWGLTVQNKLRKKQETF